MEPTVERPGRKDDAGNTCRQSPGGGNVTAKIICRVFFFLCVIPSPLPPASLLRGLLSSAAATSKSGFLNYKSLAVFVHVKFCCHSPHKRSAKQS